MANTTFFQAFDYSWAQDGDAAGWEPEQYKQGWATIGDTKPAVEQFNTTHQLIDQKANYLFRQLKTAADDKSVATAANKDDTLKELLDGIETRLLDKFYPVGAVEIMTNNVTPAQRGLPGTWEQIKDGFLYAHGAPKAGSLGSTGGATDVTLTEAQMPKHRHNVSATTNNTGGHTHSRGSMEIKGGFAVRRSGISTVGEVLSNRSEAFSPDSSYDSSDTFSRVSTEGAEEKRQGTSFRASRAWTGRTSNEGNHSHTVSVSQSDKGGGQSHNNMPPYLVENMWKRVAE